MEFQEVQQKHDFQADPTGLTHFLGQVESETFQIVAVIPKKRVQIQVRNNNVLNTPNFCMS